MAAVLYRLGAWSFRSPWRVISTWLIIIAATLSTGVALGGKLQESFSIPGTESQLAIDQLTEVFPQAAGASAQAVVVVPDGQSVQNEPYRAAIEQLTAALAEIEDIEQTISPFSEYAGKAISDDGTTAFVQIQFPGVASSVTDETLEQVVATADIAESVGMTIAYGGEVFQQQTFGLTITEVLGVAFAAVVLIVTFGSLMAAGMPLLIALVGVAISFGAVLIAARFLVVSSASPMLAVMLGLAVGIDYSLFIVSRHRINLTRGMNPQESAAQSVATAGSAVVFAGATVVIALLGLLVVGIPFLSVMGVAAAGAVVIAVLAALTMLPALMGLAGRRLIPKPQSRAARRALSSDEGGKPTIGRRWINGVLRAPIVFVVAVVGVLGTLAMPAFSMQLSLPTSASEPKDSTQYEAYVLLRDGFGPGFNGPLIVSVDVTQTEQVFETLDAVAEELRELEGVAWVADGIPNPSVDTAIIRVVPESAPDSPETIALVERIRQIAPDIEEANNTSIAVTGYTAVSIDISQRLAQSLVPFALTIVGLSVLLLMVVFRSVFVPIKAALGFLLSAAAAIGVTVAVFQWGWAAELLHIEHVGPVLSFLPVLLIALLFGLAMDYEVFITSGMREEYVNRVDPRNSRGAVVHGFQHAARVVTAAALIMFFVFFAFVPEGTGAIKGIAFALAVGVFLDAFLVRMTLGPAFMAFVGHGAWWLPRWLDRLLPNVDIEGETLREARDEHHWAVAQPGIAAAENAVIEYVDDSGNALNSQPMSFQADKDEHVLFTGTSRERRLFLLALAGRYPLAAGKLQASGFSARFEAGRLLRLVRMVDIEAEVAQAVVAGVDPAERAQTALRAALRERPEVLCIALPESPVDVAQHIWQSVAETLHPQLPVVMAGPSQAADVKGWGRPVRVIDLQSQASEPVNQGTGGRK